MKCSFRALARLARDELSLTAMGWERVYIDIQAAMRAYPDDVELQREACRYEVPVETPLFLIAHALT